MEKNDHLSEGPQRIIHILDMEKKSKNRLKRILLKRRERARDKEVSTMVTKDKKSFKNR